MRDLLVSILFGLLALTIVVPVAADSFVGICAGVIDGDTIVTQPTPSAASTVVGPDEPVVTDVFGDEMCCCEVKKIKKESGEEDFEEEYLYQWQKKVACELHAMQVNEVDDSFHFFERCVSRSNCPVR